MTVLHACDACQQTRPLPLIVGGAGDPPQGPAERAARALTVLVDMAADPDVTALSGLALTCAATRRAPQARAARATMTGDGQAVQPGRPRTTPGAPRRLAAPHLLLVILA